MRYKTKKEKEATNDNSIAYLLGLMKRSVITPPYLFHESQMNVRLIEMMIKNTVAKDVWSSLMVKMKIILLRLDMQSNTALICRQHT